LQNNLKKAIRKIHLWLGLTSGLVVFLVGLTGCLYVFQEEISLMMQSGVFRNVEVQQKPFISPIRIKEIVEQEYGKPIINMNVTTYQGGDRANIVWVRGEDRRYTAFLLNPYTGEVIDTYPYNITFWAIVLAIHTSLLIPEIGHHFVAVGTLIFVIMMISGLFLWFPKSKKGYKQRFQVKWGASFKRLNYDLHNVLGFYMTWLSIFIAITGLVWSYEWVDKSIYWLASGGETVKETEMAVSDTRFIGQEKNGKIDNEMLQLIDQEEELYSYFLIYPYDSTSCYNLTLNYSKGSFYNRNDTYLIDQYTGEIRVSSLWQNKNNGDILQEANYNIHVGAILGLPGKFLAFFASLIATSLPVTGFLIWRGRKKKKRKVTPPVKKKEMALA